MGSREVRLITLPVSLYNEYARWGLTHAGVPFTEERQPLVWHIVASRRAGGDGTTPVLVAEDEIVTDSARIVEWADRHAEPGRALFPDGGPGDEARKLVGHFNEDMGPECRKLIWTHLVHDRELVRRYWSAGLSRGQRRALRILLPIGALGTRRRLGIEPDTAETAPRRIRAVFEEVSERLSDGRRHLLGDRLTAADISFACMASPVILPQRGFTVPHPALEDYPEPLRSSLRELRDHPAGKYGLGLFAERAH
jgi:glutathione S-transferase